MSVGADVALMEAALRQLDGEMDYNRLASDLGLSNNNPARNYNAARMRWSRFKTRLSDGSKKAPTAKVVKVQVVTPPKTPKGKVKGSKKRKLASTYDEIDLGIKAEDASSEEMWEGTVPETPSRRLAARKAQGTSFREEPSDVEVEDKEGFEDSGHGSAHGGTEESDGFDVGSDEGEI
jgi:hypothetical protein